MSLQPILPLLVLVLLAAAIVLARAVTLRRMPASARTRTALWRWIGLTVAAVLLLIAAARPVVGTEAPVATRVAGDLEPNVFVVVDRSLDMADRDGDQTRMELVRNDIGALIDRYPDARFAVITFASRPALEWPLSADTWSLRPVMAALTPYAAEPDSVTQTNTGAAGTVLRYQLIGAAQQYPRARNLVYYLGAGAGESEVQQRRFDLPEGSVDGGAVLGYSNEPVLRDVAAQIDVPYVSRSDAKPLADVLPDDGTDNGSGPTIVTPPGRIETYWVFAGVAGILILLELYLVLRDVRRRSSFATVEVRS